MAEENNEPKNKFKRKEIIIPVAVIFICLTILSLVVNNMNQENTELNLTQIQDNIELINNETLSLLNDTTVVEDNVEVLDNVSDIIKVEDNISINTTE